LHRQRQLAEEVEIELAQFLAISRHSREVGASKAQNEHFIGKQLAFFGATMRL
jgi:hypothetical protein